MHGTIQVLPAGTTLPATDSSPAANLERLYQRLLDEEVDRLVKLAAQPS